MGCALGTKKAGSTSYQEGRWPSFSPLAQQLHWAAVKTAVREAISRTRCIPSLLCAFPGVPKHITTNWVTIKTTEISLLTVLETRSLKSSTSLSIPQPTLNSKWFHLEILS